MYTADKTGCAEQSTNWFQITNNEWDPVQNGKDFNLECNCCDQLILQKTTTYRHGLEIENIELSSKNVTDISTPYFKSCTRDI